MTDKQINDLREEAERGTLFTQVERMIELALFAEVCCDKPEDRMWHAEDDTWWRREGDRWVSADHPPAYKRQTEG